MHIDEYFRPPHAEQALIRYAAFARERGSPVAHKLELYQYSSLAFRSSLGVEAQWTAFEEIYNRLRSSGWQVFRNGKVSDATTIFQKFRTTCAPCAWRSGLSLIDAGIPENLVKISDCVLCVQDLKDLRTGTVSVMAISKFLHFFNPMLFPICDRAVVREIVLARFADQWTEFCKRYHLNSRSKGMDFYCAYVGWASEVIRETGQPLMSLFAEWLIEESATDGNAVHVALSMARELYASAFEFIAIGGALLESGSAVQPVFPEQSPSGVDRSLLRMMLKLSPLEQLILMERHAQETEALLEYGRKHRAAQAGKNR